jgi:hypothetical protein
MKMVKAETQQKIADFFAKNELISEVFDDEQGDFFAVINTDWQGNYDEENYTVTCSATEWDEKAMRWSGNGGYIGGFLVKNGIAGEWGL